METVNLKVGENFAKSREELVFKIETYRNKLDRFIALSSSENDLVEAEDLIQPKLTIAKKQKIAYLFK